MDKKYVYICTNDKYEGFVKIGRTDIHPDMRAIQLSRQSGVRGTFKAVWWKEVPDDYIAEKVLHYCFKDLKDEKEFYEIDKDEAIRISKKVLDTFFEMILKVREAPIEGEKERIESLIDDLKLAQKYV